MYDLTPEEGVQMLPLVEFTAVFMVSENVASIMIVGVKAALAFLWKGRNLRDSITEASNTFFNHFIGQEARSRDSCKCHILRIYIVKQVCPEVDRASTAIPCAIQVFLYDGFDLGRVVMEEAHLFLIDPFFHQGYDLWSTLCDVFLIA